MKVWKEVAEADAAPFRGAVVMIGNFDGLHLGHQSLLAAAEKAAAGGPKVVITFDPHPLQVLAPEKALKRLFPREDLAEQLPAYGTDLLVILPFTREFSQQSAEEFLKNYVQPFAPKHIVAGHDFGFGRSRQGSLDSLKEWCAGHGAALHVVAPLKMDGQLVSSRRLRELITSGQVEEAARLLGRPFYLRGMVIEGAGRGSQIGIPTLNQRPVNETIPQQGVYATRTTWRGKKMASVTNIGFNPTFGSAEGLKIETHVLDGRCEARGETVDVEFVRRLRPEMKFQSIEDLKKQIQSDILKAKEVLGVK